MNLGIEDAFVFSALFKSGRLAEYGAQRLKVDGQVVRRVEMVSRLARGESIASRVLRATLFPAITRIPMLRNRFLRMASGLDHPLPEFMIHGAERVSQAAINQPKELSEPEPRHA